MSAETRAFLAAHQVGLLFVLVFGLLLLASAAALLMSLREQSEQQLARFEQFRRTLRNSWVLSTIFWLAWIAGPVFSTLLFTLIALWTLREFITLSPTRRGDHRSLVLAFFVITPLQFYLVASRSFDLFSVFIPVYCFLIIPVISAMANDPQRFLERNANIQWGLTVCVYGTSHAPALLLLDFPGFQDKGAFLVFFFVIVVQAALLIQTLNARALKAKPLAPAVSQSFTLRSALVGTLGGGVLGGLLWWITPFVPASALGMGLIASGAGICGHFVMKALKRDRGVRNWGNEGDFRASNDSAEAGRNNLAGVTGATGLLDKVAALCFAAPVFFHSVRWYFDLR